ncbi:hypothetical protein HDE_01270 [Halotydeus destructor]|nr:hypothetical protein HDE_01270 [Halotydeus destructor]
MAAKVYQYLVFTVLSLLTVLNSVDKSDCRLHRRSHKHLNICRKEFLKPLERREEDASLVFTGTVEKVYRHTGHPGHYRGLVRVKRVIKGMKQYQGNRVIVEGFGSQKICVADVKEKDSRIFLANLANHGRLKLNSSLIRVNRKNLRKAMTASSKSRRWANSNYGHLYARKRPRLGRANFH